MEEGRNECGRGVLEFTGCEDFGCERRECGPDGFGTVVSTVVSTVTDLLFGFAWTNISSGGVCLALLGWFGEDLDLSGLLGSGFLWGFLGTATACLDGFAIIFIV